LAPILRYCIALHTFCHCLKVPSELVRSLLSESLHGDRLVSSSSWFDAALQAPAAAPAHQQYGGQSAVPWANHDQQQLVRWLEQQHPGLRGGVPVAVCSSSTHYPDSARGDYGYTLHFTATATGGYYDASTPEFSRKPQNLLAEGRSSTSSF
jgi:hypothetical protein